MRASTDRAIKIGAVVAATAVLSASTGAVAAGMVTSRQIADDTIKVVDLNFTIGQEATHNTADVPLPTKAYAQVAAATYSNDDGGGLATGYGLAEVTNPSEATIDVTVRLVHRNEPHHTTEFTSTVAPHSTLTVPAFIQCNNIRPGQQTVLMYVSGAGATVTDASLSMVAAPRR